MIHVEYVNIQYQNGTTSFAVKSQRRRGEDPQLNISRVGGMIRWELINLHNYPQEQVAGQPRRTRLDFYIGLNNLIGERTLFPTSAGIANCKLPPWNAAGTERASGKLIRMEDPIGRIQIQNVLVVVPPFLLAKSHSNAYLNVDVETAWYGIKDQGGRITSAEIHFGIMHDYVVTNTNLMPQAYFEMTENEYASLLEIIDETIDLFNTVYSTYL